MSTDLASPAVSQMAVCLNGLMQSLLANMDCTSSGPELARTDSVLDAVIWISQALKNLIPETVTSCFEKAGCFTGEISASVENENDQQDLQNCMNEAAFSDQC